MFLQSSTIKCSAFKVALENFYSVEKVKSEYRDGRGIFTKENKQPDPRSLSFSSDILTKKKHFVERPRVRIHLIRKFLLSTFK